MKLIEKRTIDFNSIKIEETEGKKIIVGMIPYNKRSQKMFLNYSLCEYETLASTVFNKTLADGVSVYANFNHDDNCILGNTRSGTLKLKNTDECLICECELPNSDIGLRAYETVKRGDTTKMSFEFYPFDWVEENDTVILRSAKLTAVSFCVINPAYEDTESFVSVRSFCQKRSINLENIKNIFEKNKVENEVQKMDLEKLIESLSELLPKDKPEVKENEREEKPENEKEVIEEKETSENDKENSEEEKTENEKPENEKETLKELFDLLDGLKEKLLNDSSVESKEQPEDTLNDDNEKLEKVLNEIDEELNSIN